MLTATNSDGEREDMAGFTCDDWPECETCGHISEELVEWDHLSAEAQHQGRIEELIDKHRETFDML